MDVFTLRKQVIDDYARYVQSFVRIRDARVRGFVDEQMADGVLWPDPLIQLNPAYASGGSIDQLVADGTLHPETARIFRRDKSKGLGEPLRLYRHQKEAIEVAKTGKSYVLTTGTGSGKSLAYMIPIIDHVLRQPLAKRKDHTSAIVVYPMNALCNSQMEELKKFLKQGYGPGAEPVTFGRFTGQETNEEREALTSSPPDILLTNFMMLELIMTRPRDIDRKVIRAAQGLDFLVLDELHTYRGRQGADVAMLVRRVRERTHASQLRCVGTSATIAGAPTRMERLVQVAEVASLIFGAPVAATEVIDETLVRVTEGSPTSEALVARLAGAPDYPTDHARFVTDPLAAWVEQRLGLRMEEDRPVRAAPLSVTAAAKLLAKDTGMPEATCTQHLQAVLLAGFRTLHPDTGLPFFAFRLHQFISRGDTVYTSAESPANRHVTLHAQQFVPGDRSRILLPLAFCRECGQDYYVVDWDQKEQQLVERGRGGGRRPRDGELKARDVSSRSDKDDEAVISGYVALADGLDWTGTPEEYPEDWLEVNAAGEQQVRRDYRRLEPIKMKVALDGKCSTGTALDGIDGWFLLAPFRMCIRCGISYAGSQRSDIGKLTELSTEGRSTATTVLSLSIVQALRAASDIPETARKLLSFTDNRQDASLQAGHFNDFIQVAMLRGALCRAIEDAPSGIGYEDLALLATGALGLEYADFGKNPDDPYSIDDSIKALRSVVGYRVFHDMRRGWRLTSPNLEQTGLLAVDYDHLHDLCTDDSKWQGSHEVLALASPEEREAASRELLDWMRRELAVNAECLESDEQERVQRRSAQYLRSSREPNPLGGLTWGIESDERLQPFRVVRLNPVQTGSRDREVALTAASGIGHYLRSTSTWRALSNKKMPPKQFPELARALVEVLAKYGFIEAYSGPEFKEPQDKDKQPQLYRLKMARVRWLRGDGTPAVDHTRTPHVPDERGEANVFFRELYRVVAQNLRNLEAREHTAQVSVEDREDREERFREGNLPVLYCSPTMELGVDISDLSAVNLRNVPPTPANYAQRSGRAGRGGQPALVVTYCSSMNQHDQYFFRRPELMVSGSVQPPRLDLVNEDLVRAHVHAEWLAGTQFSLGTSMQDIIDLAGGKALPVLPGATASLEALEAKQRAAAVFRPIFAALQTRLETAGWFGPEWLDRTLEQAPHEFNRAADRWRTMYRAAESQRDAHNRIATDMSVARSDRDNAIRLRGEAERQIELLAGGGRDFTSDFNPYRYFASEGFLPGYNFPRLPVSAYLPGERQQGSNRRDAAAISRPRFLAVSEFGPRSLIYHEGARFRVDGVILPAAEEDGSRLTSCKLCGLCGFAHFAPYLKDEKCHGCGESMDGASRQYDALLRLSGVRTQRIARITSDEEERLRLGYELRTAFAFAETTDGPRRTRASYTDADAVLAQGELALTATLWRFNLGWVRRKDKNVHGFNLNTATGVWARSDQETPAPNQTDSDEEPADDGSQHRARVVPFVEDRRNAFLLRVVDGLSPDVTLSLQYALKRGIETVYQVEPSELAVEPLPTEDDPKQMLFYESAEGGAGVLERWAVDPGAMAKVALAALDVCHFAADGTDLRRAPHAREDCEAACYDCLLSYNNTRYHDRLDRVAVRDILLALSRCTTSVGVGHRSRDEQLATLRSNADPASSLEQEFLTFLNAGGYRLPDEAQKHIDSASANPDFYYQDTAACIYVDGPHHRFPERASRDVAADKRLRELGHEVVRFSDQDNWDAIVRRYAWIFGEGTR